MERMIVTNPDQSYTLTEGERRLDLPAGTPMAEVDLAAAAFFTPNPDPE